MKRDVLRTYSGAFAAVRTSAGNVECTDDVEHIFFKGVCRCFLCDTGFGVIEYAAFAGAGRTSVTASVATDATGKFASPEFKSLVGSHRFEFFDLIEAVCFHHFAFFADELVVDGVIFALASKATNYTSMEEINSFEKLSALVKDMTAHKAELGISGVFASTSLKSGEDWRFQTHLANLPIYY